MRKQAAKPGANGQPARLVDKLLFARKPLVGTNGSAKAAQPGDYQMADILRLVKVTLTNVQAAIDYVPHPYPGRITLLRTSQAFGQSRTHPDLGWRSLAEGGVEIYRVPGHHLDVLRSPHVRVLAGQLQRKIEAAELTYSHG